MNIRTPQAANSRKIILTRDGLMFLIMGYRGEEAAKRKGCFNSMEKELMERNPATELELLLGGENGLVAQDKRLKELETKTAQVAEKKWGPMQRGWLGWITTFRKLGACRRPMRA